MLSGCGLPLPGNWSGLLYWESLFSEFQNDSLGDWTRLYLE